MANTLSEKLESAILKIVMLDRSVGRHQNYWGEWESSIRSSVPTLTPSDLVSAFKRLWQRGYIRLSKPNSHEYHAIDYSDVEEDSFFYEGNFNASITLETAVG